MKFNRSKLRSLTASIFAILLLSVAAAAKGESSSVFPNIHIKNFGQMDARFYRGAEPKTADDFNALKQLGINTVIDLQSEPASSERSMVESLGMRYVNIPMIDKAYPKPEWVAAFLKTVDDPATGKFFVHCAGGRHRTGAMGAVYRYEKYGWNYDQVYAEMKQYDFYTSWGHGDFKTFVEDYGRQMQTRGANANATSTVSAPVITTAVKSSAEVVLTGNHN
ncbi:MAG TPA: tyrosine-protein phosphatase [Pyrinomonadaceae bacterium]|nr:tyrosine-protein phosphatase [Pyrinomonadaceae bacterium]